MQHFVRNVVFLNFGSKTPVLCLFLLEKSHRIEGKENIEIQIRVKFFEKISFQGLSFGKKGRNTRCNRVGGK